MDELNIEDFWQILWAEDDGVSSSTVSNAYLANDDNKDYINEITYELFRLYQQDNTINIKVLSKTLETFISLSRKFHIPHLKLITDAGQ